MKSMHVALGLALSLGFPTAASADMVRHAGEWETTLDGGQPTLACAQHDEVFDKNTVMRGMDRLPDAKCLMPSLDTTGSVTSFNLQCDFNGNHMVTTGTVTQTGTDAYQIKSHMHVDGGVMKLPDGKTFPMPDQDTTTVSHRTGPCKPGDHMLNDLLND